MCDPANSFAVQKNRDYADRNSYSAKTYGNFPIRGAEDPASDPDKLYGPAKYTEDQRFAMVLEALAASAYNPNFLPFMGASAGSIFNHSYIPQEYDTYRGVQYGARHNAANVLTDPLNRRVVEKVISDRSPYRDKTNSLPYRGE